MCRVHYWRSCLDRARITRICTMIRKIAVIVLIGVVIVLIWFWTPDWHFLVSPTALIVIVYFFLEHELDEI